MVLGSQREPAPATKPVIDEEAKRDFASTMVFGSLVTLADDHRKSRPPRPASEEIESRPPVPIVLPPVTPVKVAEAPLPQPVKVENLPKSDNSPKTEPSAKFEAEPSKPSVKTKAAVARADDTGDAPIADVDAESERFFSEGETPRPVGTDTLDGEEPLTLTDKAKRKSEPAVVERRARFERYVKWAVAGAAVVCLAAAGTVLLPKSSPAVSAHLTAEAPPEPKAAAPAAIAPKGEAAKPEGAKAEGAKAEGTSPEGVKPEPAKEAANANPSPEGAKPDPAKAESANANPSPEGAKPEPGNAAPPAAETAKPETTAATEGSGDAKQEKQAAQRALERRKLTDAIAAGERSVAFDPTDGEAWLILGAAYQEKGNMVEARRAYSSCVKDAKTGPRAECAKMLR
jgi:hypothetical protein